MKSFTPRPAGWIALLPLLLCLVACSAAPPVPSSPDRLLDADVPPDQRAAWLQCMGPIASAHDPSAYAGALEQILLRDDQPDDMRRLALDRLAEYDEAALVRLLDRDLAVIDRLPVLEYLCDAAAGRGWVELVPALVGGYARPAAHVRDADRPERRAIAALRPGVSLEQAVFEVFDAPQGAVSEARRAQAWALLNRLEDPRDRLARATSPAVLVRWMQEAAAVLDELPATAQGCAMLVMAQGRAWHELSAGRPAGEGLALRHLVLVGRGDTAPVERVFQDLRRRTDHVTRREQAERDETWSESIDDPSNRVTVADLRVIALVQAAMRDPSVVAAWFAQADADFADPDAEHGGALVWSDEGPAQAVAYPSDTPAHDHQFITPPMMLLRLAQGGVHYHFHAQSHRNGVFAGPGPGDLAFVERYEVAAVVLTFIDRDTLNVDYHQPARDRGRIVIDLGCIHRPAPAR